MRTLATLALFSVLAFGQNQKPKVVVISLDGFPASALADPKLPVPTLRKLIQNGVTAPMATINPTVTWPNHTAMVTGVLADQHGLLANGTIVRTGSWPPVKVEPYIEKEKMVHVPTVYDAAHKAGLTTAHVDWVAIEKAPGITWAFREWAGPDGSLEQEMLRKGAITPAELEGFSKANILFRDQIWTRAAVYLIKEHQPDLLLFHLLSLDSASHQSGPNTTASRAAMAFLDTCVERVVAAVEQAGLTSQTTFLIVADHGFKAYSKQIRANAALQAAGLGEKVYVLPEGGTAFVYVDDSKLVSQAQRTLAALEGVERVYPASDFPSLGLPLPDKDPQFGQLLLAAKAGYTFSNAPRDASNPIAAANGGSHGYLASDPDMDALFIASGRGVSRGSKFDRVANIDIASTIARLLGIQLPTSKGKVLFGGE